MWEPDRTNELVKEVDCCQITELKQRKYKDTQITNKLKVTKRRQSTSKVKRYVERFFILELMRERTPKEYVPVDNDDLFGDAFND